ncbi:MAG: tRNA lysidine(34) synthetase TilS [Phycisphaerales bacterium]|nr:tRNA lysidine(34) synthetase TilS [Phycisphaerales bacterium]
MLRILSNQLAADGLLASDELLIVGVSGGPDSTALLHLLLDLNRQQDWMLRPHVAHLNHGLRAEEGERDAGFVQALADHLELPCSIETLDVAALAASQGSSIEEAGRGARYRFFERVAQQQGARFVAVGHQYDDNAETILHRILRGTGLRGLAGIPHVRPIRAGSPVRLIRPLLRFSKEQLVHYLKDNGIAWREDRTNQSNEIMRNRLRHEVLPLVEDRVNPQVREALTRLGEQAAWLGEYLTETVQRTFETLIISRTDQQLELNVEALARKSRLVQTELIRLAYISFGLGEQDLAFANLVAVLDLVAEPGSGKHVQLPQGMEVTKSYHRLIFSLPADEAREEIAPEIAIHLPGRTRLPLRGFEIECQMRDAAPGEWETLRRQATEFEEYLSLDAVRPPLIVRSRKPGDRFWPLGAPGTKKVADFLIDAKVDPRERERVAVLCDQLGPIWVIGQRIDERVKLTSHTKRILHLHTRSVE